MARKLLLVPVLVIGLFVAILDAPAAPPDGRGWNASPAWSNSTPAGMADHKPAGGGDGRRIK